jgi:excinuclease ABC subunit B
MKRETNFKLKSDYSPAEDRPTAIKELTDNILKGNRYQTLKGVTGSNMYKDDDWLTI